MKLPLKRSCSSVTVSPVTDEGGSSSKQRKVDIISQLPEHILHHILSCLTTKDDATVTRSSSKTWNAVTTRAVSKTWNTAWDTIPVLKFDQRVFEDFTNSMNKKKGVNKTNPKTIVQNFCNYVENSLWRHKSDISRLQKLQIVVDLCGNGRHAVDVEDIHGWLYIAKAKKVRSLYFQCRRHSVLKDEWRYEMYESLFCYESLEELDLFGCKFLEDGVRKSSFGVSLKRLSLVHVRVHQISLQSFLSSCCNVEEVRIQYCDEFETVKLAGENLKMVNFVLSRSKLQTITVEAPNLQYIHCGGQWDNIKRSILDSDCKNLKELVIYDSGTESDITKVVSLKFPSIEKVTLKKYCLQ